MSVISAALQAKVEHSKTIIRKIISDHSPVVFANSLGAEDMVLTALLANDFPEVTIFSLDTGRLPTETYDLMQQVEEHFDIKLKMYYPNTADLEAFVRNEGINPFYRRIELRKGCCGIRKVEPLKRALADQGAWITGLRRSQSVTRTELADIEHDDAFGLYKANPLANWEEKDVWDYIQANNIPYNTLHDKNYPSIGCAPCTRAITVGEDVRAGRWWWENPELKECGLHAGPTSAVK